jgi:murein DD-endopeptidase MepM/ murein hydrolase activator NlpD
MKHKITLILFRNSGAKVNQISFLKSSVFAAGIGLLIGLLGLMGIILHYIQIRQDITNNQALIANNASQKHEIETQRLQIRKFADEINLLKTKLINLNQFEKKIRIIANIEKTGDSESLFGIGGSIPEDRELDASLETRNDLLIREMDEQVDSLQHAYGAQLESMSEVLQKLEEKRNILAATPSIPPTTGWISSGFGYRISPFSGRREMHKGIDLVAPKGAPVAATAEGVVIFAGKKGLLGNTVVVDHGQGISTRYAHCSKLMKKCGEAVRRGDIIARVGNTGRSTGPHLHYEVRVSNIQVNPERYILDSYAGKSTKSAG